MSGQHPCSLCRDIDPPTTTTTTLCVAKRVLLIFWIPPGCGESKSPTGGIRPRENGEQSPWRAQSSSSGTPVCCPRPPTSTASDGARRPESGPDKNPACSTYPPWSAKPPERTPAGGLLPHSRRDLAKHQAAAGAAVSWRHRQHRRAPDLHALTLPAGVRPDQPPHSTSGASPLRDAVRRAAV